MDEALKIFKKLSDIPGIISHSKVLPYPKDIDFFVPIKIMPLAKKIFEEKQYICVFSSIHHYVYYKFIGGNLYLFDLCSDYNFYFKTFKNLKISNEGNIKMGKDLSLNKIIKKFSKKGNFSPSDQPKLKEFFTQKENFINFPSYIADSDDCVSLLGNLISKKRILGLFRLRVKNFFTRLNKGKSYAFIGPDGSGKGLFINSLKNTKSVKIQYMGDWFFGLQPLYSMLLKFPSPMNRFIYIFYFIENIIRRLKVSFWVLIGETVFIDRFPGTNTQIILKGFPGFINKIIFKIMPKPGLFVILQAKPETVRRRKKELNLRQIEEIQINQKKLISNYPNVVINTEDLDGSLNYLLKKLYEN